MAVANKRRPANIPTEHRRPDTPDRPPPRWSYIHINRGPSRQLAKPGSPARTSVASALGVRLSSLGWRRRSGSGRGARACGRRAGSGSAAAPSAVRGPVRRASGVSAVRFRLAETARHSGSSPADSPKQRHGSPIGQRLFRVPWGSSWLPVITPVLVSSASGTVTCRMSAQADHLVLHADHCPTCGSAHFTASRPALGVVGQVSETSHPT